MPNGVWRWGEVRLYAVSSGDLEGAGELKGLDLGRGWQNGEDKFRFRARG